MERSKRHLRMYALGFMCVLLLAAFARPVLAQHEMHNMPGMEKPKPARKPAAKRKQTTTSTGQKQDNADKPNEAEMPPPATPKPQPTPQSTPPAETNVPKAAMPAEPATQTPEAPPKHEMSNMETGEPESQPQPVKGNDSMPGMDMSGMKHSSSGTGRISGDDPRALMIMSGEMMDIRVGSKERNSIAMGQMGSGTSWQPTTTPMFMWSKVTDKWLVFIHGDFKLGVNSQGGPRGVTKFESQNWIMPMAFRHVGPGTLGLRGMFSLEPLTFSPGGSPQLFQTGETYRKEPLIDRQHPHDLFMELSATYTMPLGERATWFVYGGFPGEPSLGPTTFMHRWSASENPSAPLSHHLQDSTHISFGVFSTGFTYRWLKLEASLFNGQEPDENRYNFEFHPWNSRAIRFSIAPTGNLSLQWSYGLLKDPEELKPGDVRRMTASVAYNKRLHRGNWATSLIWGRNDENHANDVETLNGYLAESTLNFLDRNYLYTRLELVDKADLLNDSELQRVAINDPHTIFRVGAYTVGFARDVWKTEKVSVALGSDLTLYSKPDALDAVYGNNPISYKFFLRIRPSRMSMGNSRQ